MNRNLDMDASLAKTPLFDWHRDHGGRLVDFVGWAMPVQYTSISAEHLATRQAAALFDVSHMARFRIHGDGATAWLDGLLTRRIVDLPPGRIRYSLMTRDDGGILDDVLVYRLGDETTADDLLLVVNAGNRTRIWDWLKQHRSPASNVRMADQTTATAMIAVQGPVALEIVRTELDLNELATMKRFTSRQAILDSHPVLFSRTGYTGEDGVELIVPAAIATDIWDRILQAGQTRGVRPAGLGARDTLRLEAAMPLYGHELSEGMTPLQAGVDFAINLPGRSFPGHELLRSIDVESLPRRVGLRLAGKRVGRQHSAVLSRDGNAIGEVTSGTFSPSLQQSIAMAYVRADHAEPGTRVRVDVRGRQEAAEVVPLPFYDRRSS